MGSNAHRGGAGYRFSSFVVRGLPPWMMIETFQALLAVAFIGVGAGGLITLGLEPGLAVADVLPTWVRIEWSVTFILGGLLQLLGVSLSSRASERLGCALSIIGCITYSLALFARQQAASMVVGVVFGLLAVGYVVRLCVSTVGRTELECAIQRSRRHDAH